MPELPEVETISRQLGAAISQKKILSVQVLDRKSFGGNETWLSDKEVKAVSRIAKVIEIGFDKSEYVLLVHLKMTGQLIYVDGEKRVAGGHPTGDWAGSLPSAHTRVIITFADKSKLFFNDLRKFGWMKLVKRVEWEEKREGMPEDVISDEFDTGYLEKILEKSGRAVKLLIMDQTKMGGMGNIYANDALYIAGIRPERKAKTLSHDEADKLCQAMKQVLSLGIKMGGASAADENYVNLAGMGGKYQNYFQVYEKAGTRCKKCGGVIKKMKLGGRGTYYCESCQK